MEDGHRALIDDLSSLLLEAQNFEFHDFKNVKYATPKVELERKLRLMAESVKEGKYDN